MESVLCQILITAAAAANQPAAHGQEWSTREQPTNAAHSLHYTTPAHITLRATAILRHVLLNSCLRVPLLVPCRLAEMDGDTASDVSLSALQEEAAVLDDSSISTSVTDLHALAAFGEIDSLEQALRSRAAANSTPLDALVIQPDELGLTLLHAAAQSGQAHVSAILTLTGPYTGRQNPSSANIPICAPDTLCCVVLCCVAGRLWLCCSH